MADQGLKDRCSGALRKISPMLEILPKSYHLHGVILSDIAPYASGAYMGIWKGKVEGGQVSVKVFWIQRPGVPGGIKQVCDCILAKG